MAISPNRTRRKQYAPGAVEGNVARRLDQQQELERQLDRSGQLDFDQQYRRRRESQAEKLSRQRSQVKASIRPRQSVSPVMVMGFAVVAVMLLALLMCYVQLYSLSRSVVSLKSELTAAETENVRLMTDHERAFDLTSVKSAAEAEGMTAPSDSQIFFITLPGEDQVVSYSGAETEAAGTFFAAVEDLFSEIVEYFR